jgi:isoquinoline 1-oxidoreductase
MSIQSDNALEPERYELHAPPIYRFDANRREFVEILGAGLVIAVAADAAPGQEGRRGRGRGRDRGDDARPEKLSRRFHISEDGVVTVFTSKVEVGQGSRTQLSQAAAEELGLPLEQIRLVMADTELCPDDGGTAGSRTTPSNVPQIRRAAAMLREVLAELAAKQLGVRSRESVRFKGGYFDAHAEDIKEQVSLGELVQLSDFKSQLDGPPPQGVSITRVDEWKVLGNPALNVRSREVVTGEHKYPSDITRPGMLYGRVLRPATLGATLQSIDLSPAEKMDGVTVVRDGNFVGCAAKTSWLAAKAIEAIAATAKWESPPHPSSDELFEHFKKHATTEGQGWPRPRRDQWGEGPEKIADAAQKFDVAYTVAYIQHAPMEPRAAVAEWSDGKLTAWTGSQQPSRVQSELSASLRVPQDRVRVIVPDTGGGFGGKHSGEAAVEAARLAKAAGKPVSLRWTREEEFTWAYCRPAGLIEVKAGLDDDGRLVVWDFTNYNSGESALSTPYEVPHGRTQFLAADSPLRQGSYRALASTANAFARESAMDELAVLANADPLEFRLAHLKEGRLKEVLAAAAKKFGWSERRKSASANRGVGLACGTEKGSFVAACAEVEVVDGKPKILSICQAFECGAIQNPMNLRAQVEGAIVMGLGGALTEEMRFKDGKIENPRFSEYFVPRMSDTPPMDIVLVDRPDLNSVGAGETPIIAVAPAVANAIYDATKVRVRSMPMLKDGVLRKA